MIRHIPLVLVGMAAICHVALSEEGITMDGSARTVSLFTAISRTCPKYMPVNAVSANSAITVYLEAGRKSWGDTSDSAVEQEISRRVTEVAATGEQAWCEMQRARLRHHHLSAGIFDPVKSERSDEMDMALERVSLISAISNACPAHIKVNKSVALAITEATLSEGQKKYGGDVFDPLVWSAIQVKMNEVATKGERAWCLEKRSGMRKNGTSMLFD